MGHGQTLVGDREQACARGGSMLKTISALAVIDCKVQVLCGLSYLIGHLTTCYDPIFCTRHSKFIPYTDSNQHYLVQPFCLVEINPLTEEAGAL
jgi:hypothetical protein